jgi:hypothetical protein
MHKMILGVVALAAILSSKPVSADAIDGDWCHAGSGRHLSIDGPAITTPGGNKIAGDYDRHGFRYTIPASEQPAGGVVTMHITDDETMYLTGGFAGSEFQEWRRCARPTS